MRLYQKSLIPISGVIYGQTIYWLTLMSSFLVLLGTIVSFVEKDSPIPSKQLLQSVIDGKDVDQIWQEMGLNPAPDILFFLANPSAGESITMIGIAVGVSSVVPATFFFGLLFEQIQKSSLCNCGYFGWSINVCCHDRHNFVKRF